MHQSSCNYLRHIPEIDPAILTSINLWNNYGAGMVVSNTVLGYVAGPNISYSLSPVPEPTEGALLLSGIGLLGFIAARRKSNS